MQSLRGLVTGIGSLPHQDPDKAIDLVFKYAPNIPFWPQLPKRDIREGMLAQFSENLPCLKVAREGLFFSTLGDKEKELEAFYERVIANDVDYFKISQDFALGLYRFYQRLEQADSKTIEFIKCHITGPFTFAASIKDEQTRALLHDPVFMQVILKGLTMKALWQIKFFKKFGKKIIMFVDEPYLSCFGSAYTSINREDVIRQLGELTLAVKSEDVLLGVHCCGNTDWSIFTDTKTLDIINFDAFGFLDKLVLYAANLKDFLNRGGILCWGIVPTQELTDKETAGVLIKKINEGIDILTKKGLDRDLLLDRLLLSPSCGLGTLDIQKTEKIFKLLMEISLSIRKNP
ncbi:MAG: methionine synthase [Candidatus Omnitrophota bacterium]